jgi:hypothetical protein
MPTPNEQILQIVSEPVNTIPDVVAAFTAIDAALPPSDGLKYFNALYLSVTQSVDQSVNTVRWNNPVWLSRLDVLFARLYLGALKSSLTQGQSAPGCWQVLFNARHNARLARIQFALAGMNAHIDHDLSIAVVDTCREFQFEPAHLSPIYQDFTRVNGLLNMLIDQTKHALMVGLLGDAIPDLGKLEDMVGAFGIEASREVAWTNAELLWHTWLIPTLSQRFLAGLDRAATVAGTVLLTPIIP